MRSHLILFVEDDEGTLELRARRVLKVFDVFRHDLAVSDQVALATKHNNLQTHCSAKLLNYSYYS